MRHRDLDIRLSTRAVHAATGEDAGRPPAASPARSERAAWIVVLAGVSAALHVGKLPPALPVLREALGLTLVEAGFMLSLVQLAGMTLGLVVGLAADAFGLRRGMVLGLVVLGVASCLGGAARTPATLLALRGCEGVGFLLAVTPAPSLIRRLVGAGADRALGLWGAYMPLGTALALLGAPYVIDAAGWPGWWELLGGLTLAMAAALWRVVPADAMASRGRTAASSAPGGRIAPDVGRADAARDGLRSGRSDALVREAAAADRSNTPARGLESVQARARRTLAAPGPWALALSFAVYSGQWIAVLGFLPSIYAQAGVAPAHAGLLTAFVAAANMVGNVAAGRLLHRQVAPARLLRLGFATMAVGAAVAYLPAFDGWPALRFVGLVAFSALGGLVPGTLFALSVRLAPDPRVVSTTVGWMQQCSAFGQFAGPPLVAWVAHRVGGWGWTWVVTGAMAAAGWLLSFGLARLLGRTGRSAR